MPQVAGLDCVDRCLNRARGGLDAMKVVRRKLDNRDLASGEILLVANVLVGRDKEIAFALDQPEELTVFDAAPPTLLRSGAIVANENLVHRPGHTLVEEDIHVATSDASERSRRRQAISRVTEGKHSMNSSSV